MVLQRLLILVLCVPLLALPVSARDAQPLDPEPIAVPAGTPLASVGKAIKMAFAGRGWVISEDQPGRVVGTLNIRTHMAKVEANYNEKTVQIKYLDSSNLDYKETKDGERRIHRSYFNWLKNITNDIARNLQAAAP